VVAYFPGPATDLVRTPVPADSGGEFPCCAVKYDRERNLPDARSEHYDPKLFDDETTLLFSFQDAIRDQGEGPRHRLGGHADCVQGPMELDCQLVTNGHYLGNSTCFEDPRSKILAAGALDWRLSLQIDSDDNAGTMWGDYGRIYYWIREGDLRAHEFDKCWLILQCT